MIKKLINFKKETKAVKDMVVDFTPRLFSLLNPAVWQTPETISLAVANILTGFGTSRVKKLFEDIFNKKDDLDEKIVNSEKSNQVLIDLVKFVAQDNPDTETWEATKKIFIRTLQKETTEEERISLYSYLDLCRQLNGAEIMILASAYGIYKKVESNEYPAEFRTHHTRRRWARELAGFVGYKTEEEVMRYEENLAKQKLIYPTEFINGNERGDWTPPGYVHRLTPLGINFSKALESIE